MTRYIESKPNGDGSWDHDDVESAYSSGHIIYMFMLGSGKWEINNAPSFSRSYKYRAYSPDSHGIQRPSSTLSKVKGDGPAVAEMLLDRINELESALSDLIELAEGYEVQIESEWGSSQSLSQMVQNGSLSWEITAARAALNKEQK